MLIALVGKAYTGKTAIAQELRDTHGYTILSFTDHLKNLAAFALNSICTPNSPMLTVADILADKPKYRRFIQEFGSLIGYETDPGWIEAFLEDELVNGTQLGWDGDYVIDCLRSAAQIAGARKFGAKIVGVSATTPDRAVFAAKALGRKGSALKTVKQADDHPIDGALVVESMGCDVIMRNTLIRSIPYLVDDLFGAMQFVGAL